MFVGDLVVGDFEGRLMVCLVMLSKRISRPPLRFGVSCQRMVEWAAMSTYENSSVRVMSCAILVESSTLFGEDERLSSQPFLRRDALIDESGDMRSGFSISITR